MSQLTRTIAQLGAIAEKLPADVVRFEFRVVGDLRGIYVKATHRLTKEEFSDVAYFAGDHAAIVAKTRAWLKETCPGIVLDEPEHAVVFVADKAVHVTEDTPLREVPGFCDDKPEHAEPQPDKLGMTWAMFHAYRAAGFDTQQSFTRAASDVDEFMTRYFAQNQSAESCRRAIEDSNAAMEELHD